MSKRANVSESSDEFSTFGRLGSTCEEAQRFLTPLFLFSLSFL